MDYEELEEILPEGWEVLDDATLICPHGNELEWDGDCPEDRCRNPLKAMGMI